MPEKLVNFTFIWTILFILFFTSLAFLFSQLTFARFYLPSLVPHAEKVIYVDDDVIVQGMGPLLAATGLMLKSLSHLSQNPDISVQTLEI